MTVDPGGHRAGAVRPLSFTSRSTALTGTLQKSCQLDGRVCLLHGATAGNATAVGIREWIGIDVGGIGAPGRTNFELLTRNTAWSGCLSTSATISDSSSGSTSGRPSWQRVPGSHRDNAQFTSF